MPKPSQEFLDGMAILKLRTTVNDLDYVDAMWAMEAKYPNKGWGAGAKILERFYEKKDSELPKNDLFDQEFEKIVDTYRK